MNNFIQFIFGKESFEISYEVSVDTSIERLKTGVKKVPIFGFRTEGMVGKIREKNTKIMRAIPNSHNSFKPVLVGSFKSNGNKTIFSGFFRFNRFVQVLLSYFFGFGLLWTLGAIFLVIKKPSEAWFFPLVSISLLCFGVWLTKKGNNQSQNDKAWLLENVSKTVNGNS